MTPDRPIDGFVKRSQNILQKEYLVIGKRRISSFTAWAVIAFFIGITIAVAFLASRSGTLEGGQAARAPRPVWSRWGDWKEGSAPLSAPTIQYRARTKTSTQVQNGKKTRVSAQGYEQRQCVKNCESLLASNQANGAAGTQTTYQASADFTSYAGQQSSGLSDPNRWQYLDSNGKQLTYNATNPNAGNQPAWQGNEQYLLVGNNWQHPGQNADSVRRFVAPGGGTVHITVNVHDNNTSCGDGVTVTIKQNDTQLWNVSIANGDTTGQDFNKSVSVTPQDKIDFIVNKGSADNYCDSTFFDPRIEFTPTGSSALSLACAPKTITLPVNSLQKFTAAPSGGTAPYTYSWSNTVTCGNGTTNQTQTCDLFFGAPLTNFPIPITVTDSEGATASDSCTATITNTNTAAGSITVSKASLEVSPADGSSRIRLDNDSFTSGKLVTFNTVSLGSHTIGIEVPANTKVFYAICPKAVTCKRFKEGIAGPGIFTTPVFKVEGGTQNKVSLVLTPPKMQYGSSKVKFRWNDILGAHDAHAVSGIVHGRGNWVNVEDGTTSLSCSRLFTVLDPKDASGELFKLFQEAANSWAAQTYPKPAYERDVDSTYLEDGIKIKIPYTTINIEGVVYAVYKAEDVIREDSMNFVAFTDRYSEDKSWVEANADGATYIFGFEKFSPPPDEKAYDATDYYKYIIGTDTEIDPAGTSMETYFLRQRLFLHELAHSIGLGHAKGVPSVMNEVDYSYEISAADIQAVNALYSQCAKTAQISLNFSPNPAPSVGGICTGYTDPSHWQIGTLIKETGGSIGAALNTFDVVYYDKSGNQKGSSTDKSFSTLQGGAKGFTINHINPGQSISATLCQVPWSPEQLQSLKMVVKGTDDKGNAVQATDTINF